MNQHIVEVTIIWPDDKWEDAIEQQYLLSALQDVVEHFAVRPVENREHTRTLINPLGRIYAEIHISPCKEVSNG